MSEQKEMVNHPAHYIVELDGKKYECIDVIESWGLSFNTGNALKYIWRAGRKDKSKTKEDLKKAVFYLEREISLHKNILEVYYQSEKRDNKTICSALGFTESGNEHLYSACNMILLAKQKNSHKVSEIMIEALTVAVNSLKLHIESI